MYRYHPLEDVDVLAWKELDEDEQKIAVAQAHRNLGLTDSGASMHATLHVIVENQILLGDGTPVSAAIKRLMQEGIDRHEAIHAVAGALAAHLHAIVAGQNRDLAEYYNDIATLTVEKWYREMGGDN